MSQRHMIDLLQKQIPWSCPKIIETRGQFGVIEETELLRQVKQRTGGS